MTTFDAEIEATMTRVMDGTPSPTDGGDPIVWMNTYIHLGTTAFGDVFTEYLTRKLKL